MWHNFQIQVQNPKRKLGLGLGFVTLAYFRNPNGKKNARDKNFEIHMKMTVKNTLGYRLNNPQNPGT